MDRRDLLVVGLGAMGAAVTMHAAERGLDVIGIDRYDPPHSHGSTKAETRITRLAVGEGPQYLPFVRRSHEIWRGLEQRTGLDVVHQTGGIIITEQEPIPGQRWEDFVLETARIADSANIDYDVLDPSQVRQRYPWIRIPDHRNAGYEPTAGLVMAERAVEIQLAQARAAGASLMTNETVQSIMPADDHVVVQTDRSSYAAAHVVLAAGPWLPDLVTPEHRSKLTVTRQVVLWFEAEDLDSFGVDEIPFVMWIAKRDEDYMALFPTPPGATPGVKVLGEQFLETTTPADVDRTVSQSEIDRFYQQHIAPKFDGIRPTCIRAEVCLYTTTPDDHFLIDRDPRSDRITVMSPCSGHGFKHSTALGEAVAEQVATGTSTLDLAPFRYSG